VCKKLQISVICITCDCDEAHGQNGMCMQTGKFLAQVFLHRKTCARKLVQVTLSHYASFLFKKWLHALQKCDLQSIVQSALEFHDRNLPEIEHDLFLPVSGASFWCQFLVPEKWRQKLHSHRQVFWRKKLIATETC